MKKFVSSALTIVLFLNILLSSTACKETKKEVNLISSSALRCDENGDFTILVVSDPQCDNEVQWAEAQAELETLVERSEPDFVLINGDMNSENKIPAEMWRSFISPLTERGIYWSTTNGNHDPFNNDYFEMYCSYSTCLNAKVDQSDPDYVSTRPMNYVLPIYANDGKTPVFAVYGMDSGGLNYSGYEGVTTKQIRWYKKQSDALKKLNGGTAVTSLLCMHIPLPQTIDLYYSVSGGGTVTEKTPGDLYSVYGMINEPKNGMLDYTCENGTIVSNTWFHTTAPANDRGLFDAILEQGDVKAVFFGHDHQTNFAGSYKGVLLGFVGKLSTGCYCDEVCRGGRVIKLNQSDPSKFTVSWLASLACGEDQPAIYADGSLAG